MSTTGQNDILIDISTAIMRVHNGKLQCRLVADDNENPRLPFGPFMPDSHRTMEIGLRQWVGEQVGVNLAHVEQLYTFADQGRYRADTNDRRHVVSVGYLALTPTQEMPDDEDEQAADWGDIYRFFPWEDWRDGRPAIIDAMILPALDQWARGKSSAGERIRLAFGRDDMPSDSAWDEEFVLERYELLYQAGLVKEAKLDGRPDAQKPIDGLGRPLQLDHRRILATALGRLRSKLKYRPVIFDLMPPRFTLRALQQTTEMVVGTNLHKQNFRRLVEKSGLVEATGETERARGRPAELFRFRQTDGAERPLAGLRVSAGRNKRARR